MNQECGNSSPNTLSDLAQDGTSCPTWCSGEHIVDRLASTHPSDKGVWHQAHVVDSWVPDDERDNNAPIVVQVSGFRHDEVGQDWADLVHANGAISPGNMGGVGLRSVDARRLANALLSACELLERGRQPEGPAWT